MTKQTDLTHVSHSDKGRMAELVKELTRRKEREIAQTDFLAFVKTMWPDFIYGRHHARMAQEFERVANGECKRLIINLGPRHTKSEFGSFLLPAWFLGRYPNKKVIQTAHTADLAVGFGRKVRNLVDSPVYQEIFPNVGLRSDSKAAGRWNTNAGGDYFAIGVGGAVTGKGADLLIIDDPHSEQEAAIAASNPEIYDKVYEWYTSGPRQRLQPGGSIIIIQCMTGDTPVLMASGKEKQLKDIRPNDAVATYDNGKLSTATVLNWRSNGVDKVWKIKTISGTIVRANERHPFLVDDNGIRKWIRLKELKVGMALVTLKGVITVLEQKSPGRVLPVIKRNNTEKILTNQELVTVSASLRDVIDPQDHNSLQDIVPHAKREIATTEKTPTHPTTKSGTTVSIKENYALKKGVNSPQKTRVCVLPTPVEHTGHQEKIDLQQQLNTQTELKVDTESPLKTLTECRMNKEESALYAKSPHQPTIQEHIGTENSALTIATIREKLEGCCVTTVTSLLGMVKRKLYYLEPQNTSEFTLDIIESITPDGEEEVFDVQIEGTENFIANGLVSHNTRWSKRDLTGQVLEAAAQRGNENWRVVEFPAILPSGKPLWPEFWSLKELEATREAIDVSKWQAQYQQNPTSEEGAIVKREWWQRWLKEDPPHTDFILMTWDTAFEKHQRADYSACTVWGVFYQEDDNGKMQANIILLDAKRGRYEFPELKQVVLEEYNYWQPDSLIVEKKASGAPLIYELRAMGIPVGEFTPTRGNDKISRLNAVADLFASGRVWAPNTKFADDVIEEVAAFPAGQHDDYADTVSMAMSRFRKGGFITTNLDEPEPEQEFKGRGSRRNAYY